MHGLHGLTALSSKSGVPRLIYMTACTGDPNITAVATEELLQQMDQPDSLMW